VVLRTPPRPPGPVPPPPEASDQARAAQHSLRAREAPRPPPGARRHLTHPRRPHPAATSCEQQREAIPAPATIRALKIVSAHPKIIASPPPPNPQMDPTQHPGKHKQNNG